MVLPAASLAVALRDTGVAALLLWAQLSPGVGLCSACRAVITEATHWPLREDSLSPLCP